MGAEMPGVGKERRATCAAVDWTVVVAATGTVAVVVEGELDCARRVDGEVCV